MAHGLQRNEAQKKAEQYNQKHISYSKAYIHFGVCASFANLAKGFNRFANSIKQATADFAKLAEALKENKERGAENGST